MLKFVFISNTLTTKRQIYQLVVDAFANRQVNLIYNEENNWEIKLSKDNKWNYLPLIDANIKSDLVITQYFKGDYFKYLNDLDANLIFWITDTRTYNRYKNKIKDWVPVFASLEGGNSHFYYTNSLTFIEKQKMMDIIKREENFKNILDGTTK